MTRVEVYQDNERALSTEVARRLDLAIWSWLKDKSSRSQSRKTREAYETAIYDFRSYLAEAGIDLDGPKSAVRAGAKAWADSRQPYDKNGKLLHNADKPVSAATYNQRLAILSSFYKYVATEELIDIDNPITAIKTRPIRARDKGKAFDDKDAAKSLTMIDRNTPAGKRDYALMMVGIVTGRRAQELADMKRGDLLISNGKVIITFPRTKGGKDDVKPLGVKSSAILLDYLNAVHGPNFMSLPADTPVWVSFSRRNLHKAISVQTISDTTFKYFGTTKVHALRHTFAKALVKLGIPMNEIKSLLGHSSLATTGQYLEELKAGEFRQVDQLDDLFGIGD
jgi:site-specific recombinase XerD